MSYPDRARPQPAEPGRDVAVERPRAPHLSPPGPAQAFVSNAAVHRLVARAVVQPKLTLSRPGDPLEREADAVAARVTAGPSAVETPAESPVAAPAVSRLPAVAAGAAGGDGAGGAGDESPPGGSGPDVPPGIEPLLREPGPGAPLAPAVRERIEPHLGVRLDGVQVHTGGPAQLAAERLGARAFTAGSHVFLGAGESPDDVALMAHEATHVAQQQPGTLARAVTDYIPDVVLDEVRDLAREVPGYSLLTVAVGYDPIAERDVPRTPQNLVTGMLDLVPFGGDIAARLGQMQLLQDAFTFIDRGLDTHRLTQARLGQEIDQAWNELSVTAGVSGNVAMIERHVDAVYQDAVAFAHSIVDAVIQMIRDAAASLAEEYLEGTPVWELAKKVIHYDPLRGVAVEAPTVEILADFLRLIGKEDTLAQMTERGTLQKTADWLDVQIPRFLTLIAELGALFQAGWDAIQPENIANLPANLESLARRAVDLVQRVSAFATELIGAVLRLVKDSLLGWLSSHAERIPGFRLLTVILGQNPFTGQAVPRTAENLIGGFICLLPGGEATYAQLAESGVIAQAAGRIESAMGRLGISLEMVTSTFLGVWDMLSLNDLLDPVGAFERVLDRFAEPLGRIVAFVGEVVKVVITLILELMHFPSDLLGSIIGKAVQAIDDIQRDPVAFLMNLLAALKSGLGAFFDNILNHLLQGLTDWLFRGLGQIGITIPTDLSLSSILNLVLQVLGITVESLWQKLGEHIGPENVARIRGALDMLTGAWAFIRDVQERGLAAVWDYIAGQLGNLWDTVLNMAKDWIVTEVVQAVTARLISMLDPTGVMAVVNSFIAFFDAVQSAIEYFRDILRIVDEYVTTVAAIAKGDIAPGAVKLEQGLAHAIPVAIGFLAKQVGVDNVPEKIVEIIQGLRQLVDQALDWLITQAISLGQAALAALTGSGGTDAEPPPDGADPAASVVDRAAGEVERRLSHDSAEEEVRRILAEILAELSAEGLHTLQLEAPDAEGAMAVTASASPTTTLAKLSPGSGRRQMYCRATLKFESNEPAATSGNLGAVEPTSQTSTEGEDFSWLRRPDATSANPPARERGGAVFQPATPDVVEMMSWNSSDKMSGTSNGDHAETHLVAWLESIRDRWPHLKEIVINNDPYSPCSECGPMLESVMTQINQARSGAGKGRVAARLNWQTLWLSGGNRTQPHTLPQMDSWEFNKMPVYGEQQQDALLHLAMMDRARRQAAAARPATPVTVIRRPAGTRS